MNFNRPDIRRLLLPVIITGGLYTACLYASYYPIWEDAFISFRYSLNLSRGHGIVYNIGEHVEGYTNFLWVVIIAGFKTLGIEPWIASRILGFFALSGIVTLVLTAWKPVKQWPLLLWITAGAAMILNQQIVRWATSGLETALHALLILTAMIVTGRMHRTDRAFTAAGLWLLAVLSRPDAVVIMAATLLALAFDRTLHRQIVRTGALFLLMLLPYVLWRRIFFGFWLPATYHTRMGHSLDQLVNGLGYLGLYLSSHWVFLGGLLSLPLWFNKENRWLRMTAFAVLFHLGYTAAVGGDWMRFRFLAVISPLLIILLLDTFHRAVIPFMQRRRVRPWLQSTATLLCCGILIILTVRDHPPYYFKAFDAQKILDNRTIRSTVGTLMGMYARERTPDNPILLTHFAEVAYAAEIPTINPYGLTTLEISVKKVPGLGGGKVAHEKLDWAYGLSRHPLFIYPKFPAPGYSHGSFPTSDGFEVYFSVRDDQVDPFLAWLGTHFDDVPLRHH